MVAGLIGAGNMARALARGWGDPVLCSDPATDRADALAREVGGEALASNAEVAERADVIVLCHKPAQLEEVAAEVGGRAKAVVSILGATPLEAVRNAYAGVPAFRFIPNVAVEVRKGVLCYAGAADADAELEDRVLELFGRLGAVIPVPERLIDVSMGLMSTAPAYYALIVEAQVDAGVRRGLPADEAARMVVEAMAGTADLLRARGYDTLAIRREVTSPGGVTARGLLALEGAGMRAAFADALDAVLDPGARR
jgi:pyrroline-5-carboxylate reductase